MQAIEELGGGDGIPHPDAVHDMHVLVAAEGLLQALIHPVGDVIHQAQQPVAESATQGAGPLLHGGDGTETRQAQHHRFIHATGKAGMGFADVGDDPLGRSCRQPLIIGDLGAGQHRSHDGASVDQIYHVIASRVHQHVVVPVGPVQAGEGAGLNLEAHLETIQAGELGAAQP